LAAARQAVSAYWLRLLMHEEFLKVSVLARKASN